MAPGSRRGALRAGGAAGLAGLAGLGGPAAAAGGRGAAAGAPPRGAPGRGRGAAAAAAPPATVAYEDGAVSVASQRVPVSLWYPAGAAGGGGGAAPAPLYYPHAISVAKIARVLLGLGKWVPRLLDRDVPLPAAADVVSWGAAGAGAVGAVRGGCVLCHGYLGSRFDLADFAEALAAAGFVVAAPEFAEALADPETTPRQQRPGTPPPADPSASREDIMDATLRDVLGGRFDLQAGRDGVALVGQSAGAGTALRTPGPFARVAIAGFNPPEPEAVTQDPLLVIASEGDGVISLKPRESGRFGPNPGITAAVDALPGTVARYSGGDVAELRRASEAGGGEGAPRRAFVAYEGPGSPNHISFLSSRTNDAMIETLSPLLPIAKALDIPMLDFDVYAEALDSDRVAAELVPAVVSWLCAVLPDGGGGGGGGGGGRGGAGGGGGGGAGSGSAAAPEP